MTSVFSSAFLRIRTCLAMTLLAACCLTGVVTAGTAFAASSSGDGNEAGITTKDELLLFWDEKDLYVQSATRNGKPISQAAENITVVTSKEIEDMNAHNVGEVLNRITGLFVDSSGLDLGSSSLLHIQGSEERHVLVLVDGITWNTLTGGNAETMTIPVRIIDRIEVIKGPASSSWGSALGGVINIITKKAGDTRVPTGTMSVSYGERNTSDLSAGISGRAGAAGYYIYAGRQESDGLRDGRDFRSNSFFSKFNVPVSKDVSLGFSLGYSEPQSTLAVLPSFDLLNHAIIRALYATASLDAAVAQDLKLNLQLQTLKQKFDLNNSVLGLGMIGNAGDLFQDAVYDEKTIGAAGKLVWTKGPHTAVLGVDFSHGSLDQVLTSGALLQSFGVPEVLSTNPDIDKWAVYANDTITVGSFSLTPGIRFDHNNITGSFTSPSIGATYKLAERTILRASVARGFTIPPLSLTSGGAIFLDPNPSLKPEKVWSYQAGVESGVTEYLWVKATVFRHDLSNNLVRSPLAGGPPLFNDLEVNQGDIKRQGAELEADTVPFHNFSLRAGFAYVKIAPSLKDSLVNYAYNIGIRYDDKKSLEAQLFGHYVWWNADGAMNGKYDAFIWDLNVRKKIYSTEMTDTELFLTAHNLFNGSQYASGDMKNPRRWVEAGLRFKF
ncbi:MAG: TonB-dependent receptor [Nitrospiraceae bacterium]|nr:TonB-dependent receptor [Nitrospiraceae bacterium]